MSDVTGKHHRTSFFCERVVPFQLADRCSSSGCPFVIHTLPHQGVAASGEEFTNFRCQEEPVLVYVHCVRPQPPILRR
eukprot:942069-Rhodomonas_salina.1